MVRSLCPLRAFGLNWQAPHGGWVLTVIAKATFTLAQGESTLAESQEDICEDDNHWNDDRARSVYAPSDLAPFKPRADVILVGHAFAPRREPATSLVARLVVGEIDKSIEVLGERLWTPEGDVREGARFVKMPLRWERAAGGPETSNPVGVRLDTQDTYGRTVLPNLQPPGLNIASRGDFIEPVGFGPVADAWPSRMDKLGALAADWSSSTWTSRVLPETFDFAYFNAAPRDQQASSLREDERIVLENLHAEHARLVTSLPGIRPKAFVQRPGAAPFAIRMACDTLWIDTDRALATLTWRAQLPVERTQETRVHIAMEEKGRSLTWADVEPLVTRARVAARVAQVASSNERGAAGSAERRAERTIAPDDEVNVRDAMPFARGDERAPHGGSPHERSGQGGALRDRSGRATDERKPDPPPAATSKPKRPQRATIELLPSDELTSVTDVGMPVMVDASPRWLGGGGSHDGGAPPLPLAAPPLARANAADPAERPPPPARSVPPSNFPPQAPLAVTPALHLASDSPWAKPRLTNDYPPPLVPARELPPDLGPSAGSRVPPPPAIVQAPIDSFGRAAPRMPALAWSNPGAVSAGDAPAIGPAAPATTGSTASSALSVEPAPASPAAPKAGARDYIELLWFDPAQVRLIRAQRAFKDALAREKAAADEWIDAPDATEEPEGERDRRDVYRVLARGRPVDVDGIGQAFAEAADLEVFANPVVLISGDLQFHFDEIEALKTTVSVAAPLAGGDKRMQTALDAAGEVLKGRVTPSIADGLISRIREAFGQSSRTLPATYLEATTERMLLEERHYQKRTMLGERRIRALCTPAGGTVALPCYLPELLEKQLPLFPRIRVSVVAHAVGQQNRTESQAVALVALAIGRVLPIPLRPR